jgi:hypothetical protein
MLFGSKLMVRIYLCILVIERCFFLWISLQMLSSLITSSAQMCFILLSLPSSNKEKARQLPRTVQAENISTMWFLDYSYCYSRYTEIQCALKWRMQWLRTASLTHYLSHLLFIGGWIDKRIQKFPSLLISDLFAIIFICSLSHWVVHLFSVY